MFVIFVSGSLTCDEVAIAIRALVLPGLKVVVQEQDADVPDSVGDLWVRLVSTDGEAWPLAIEVLVYPEDAGLGRYPALWLAENLGVWFRLVR